MNQIITKENDIIAEALVQLLVVPLVATCAFALIPTDNTKRIKSLFIPLIINYM